MTVSFSTRAGALIAAAATAGLGAVEVWHGAALPGLQPDGLSPITAVILGALLIASAGGVLAGGQLALLAAALWGGMLLYTAVGAAEAPSDMPNWVSVAEAAVLCAFALQRWREAIFGRVLIVAFALMLLLFGAIHIVEREGVATLIPDWIPGAEYWPWFTGALSVLAGVMCLVGGIARRIGALAVAAMYASWLVIIHAPRLQESPTSLFEWTFALIALALVGVAVAVAQSPVTTGVLSPAPHSAQEPS